MRLVFAGTPDTALPSLRALLDSPRHDVVAVVTRPDAQSGRGRKVHPSPVAELAREAGVEVLRPPKAGIPSSWSGCGRSTPTAVRWWPTERSCRRPPWTSPARLGQPPLLVAARLAGAAPVQHAVLHGDQITGATTFQIVKELDAGPVYGVVTEELRPADTSGDLLARLAESGAGLLVATMDGIEDGKLEAVPQPAEGLSFTRKISVDDARVDWSASAMRVDRLIRACTPAPGAWTEFRGQRVKLGPVRPAPDAPALEAGRIAASKKSVLVGTATHPVELGEVQPQGKRPMGAEEWARGVRPADEDRLG